HLHDALPIAHDVTLRLGRGAVIRRVGMGERKRRPGVYSRSWTAVRIFTCNSAHNAERGLAASRAATPGRWRKCTTPALVLGRVPAPCGPVSGLCRWMVGRSERA